MIELLPQLVRTLRGHSVLRRVVVSVLPAFLLIWLVLLGYVYTQTKIAISNDPGLVKYGDALLSSLATLDKPTEAASALAVLERTTNIRRSQIGIFPGSYAYELADLAGTRAYASPDFDRLQLPRLGILTDLKVGRQDYRVYQQSDARWRLTLAEPMRSDVQFLAYNARQLVPYLLLALPIVLLALLFSVRQALKPLNQLATRIATRDVADLGPVGIDAKHSEIKPLVEALDALLVLLRQKVERERTFVQDVAHEIRTPMAVIAARAHVLVNASTEAQRLEAQGQMNQAIGRASHLAQQLLVLAALDDGQQPEPRTVDVCHWLRSLLAQRAPDAMQRQIELALEAPERLEASLELSALESIVQNLLDNALRCTPVGGQVLVGLLQRGDRLELTVQDDGPGIPLAQQEHIFERFYRGGGLQASGAGLGLAIVRQAAQRLGGSVAITPSLRGQGIGFLVAIRLVRVESYQGDSQRQRVVAV